jgi:hypothetical protein
MRILNSAGHIARYLAGAAVAGAVFLAESAVLIVIFALLSMVGSGLIGLFLGLLLGFAIAFGIGLVLVTFVIFPAILLGELAARRRGNWAIAPLAALGTLLVLSMFATAVALFAFGTDEVFGQLILILATAILPALAYGLVTYPAGWLSDGATARLATIRAFMHRRVTWLNARLAPPAHPTPSPLPEAPPISAPAASEPPATPATSPSGATSASTPPGGLTLPRPAAPPQPPA